MTRQFPETFDPTTQEGNSWEVLPVGEYVAQGPRRFRFSVLRWRL